jgi:hypothetical protein
MRLFGLRRKPTVRTVGITGAGCASRPIRCIRNPGEWPAASANGSPTVPSDAKSR